MPKNTPTKDPVTQKPAAAARRPKVRATNIVSAALRIVVAVIALVTVFNLLNAGGPAQILTFTLQSNTMMAFSFLWTAFALLGGQRTPPEWLSGSSVFYLTITGIVYNFVLGPHGPSTSPPILFGLNNSDLEHMVTPIAALAIWIVFDEHRRVPWKYIVVWLYYVIGYFALILILVATIDALSAPYPFLSVELNGVGGVAWRLLVYIAGFCGLSAILVWLDHRLPAHTRVSELDPYDQ